MNSINQMFSRFRRPGNKQPNSPQQSQQQQPLPGPDFNAAAAGQVAPGGAALQPNSPGASRVAAKPLFLCKPFVTSQLVKGSFSTIVVLPKYVDHGEWLALNVFEFFDMLNRFQGVINEFCTPRNCPSMSAGPGLDYTWLDANKKPMRLPAPTYIEYVMLWISNRINDETLFPTKSSGTTTATTATPSANRPGAVAPAGAPGENWVGKEGGFPQVFEQTCRGIYKQMFRVFAHIYHTHFDKILHMSLEAHFNSLFVHFIHFSRTFNMLDQRDVEPLRALIENFEEQGLFKDSSSSRAQQQQQPQQQIQQ
ncbi:Mob1/phocein [Pyronema domesticum]|uniref:Similar to CBK1 kinase activator protein MOB2 acc. no. P43563 n=1 Tax=Pyronema omphalodes (strain CBS 100304) TaxID=1076935 RepID=U4LP77_PYROM|nr:Mob1/phocein [Pyronema domesticum]CCX33956.1 Similar to CBK1 kinase activator protein MOB2; acc. no. P43563 [Pyronema omphalodes CBS 100304]